MLLRPPVVVRFFGAAASSARAGPSRSYRSAHLFHATSTTRKPLTILALESSADDSCCAIVDSERKIHANVVLKQHHINATQGGINPIRAQEAHERNVPLAIRQALKTANMTIGDIDAVAYTRGPGMYGCLCISASAARGIAAANDKPLVGVHHMQAHALTPLLTEEKPPEFPFLVLLVSGGHTQLYWVSLVRVFIQQADSSDATDKIGRALQLPDGDRGLGAALEKMAAKPPLPPFDMQPVPPMPLPMQRQKDTLAFSFAGVLSAVERKIAELGDPAVYDEARARELSRVWQELAFGHLGNMIGRYLDSDVAKADGDPVKGLVISGGVGSNLQLRKTLADLLAPRGIEVAYPPVALCTDNAAMIAWTAILRLQNGLRGEEPTLDIRRKWSLEDLYNDVPPEAYETVEKE
ncbi:hypothetical protein A1Q1_04575 [Trichosporon asahii var. asahii CBS 2479]|uniref:N(6)-L-threonylcarbamoyladenine synthase n=1 Tax=Trichosporon asahii var. asahii (strain ATCC 90039 / CBS 2479 / JCM 2466 / KCTC 7840 / NBRC 103889/ NCYC 2677 / UAMH 7654) TaxID=1186058 RepID=J6F5P4_TRIAS|nr:hypothetical protein A1Q1_04575 [Trichosporon asahii var. asahii CBS 2479]EJT52364.1 hypothetical protein A1Q1_04575 [Trichosporon asahii var. asahii CBS 2479]